MKKNLIIITIIIIVIILGFVMFNEKEEVVTESIAPPAEPRIPGVRVIGVEDLATTTEE